MIIVEGKESSCCAIIVVKRQMWSSSRRTKEREPSSVTRDNSKRGFNLRRFSFISFHSFSHLIVITSWVCNNAMCSELYSFCCFSLVIQKLKNRIKFNRQNVAAPKHRWFNETGSQKRIEKGSFSRGLEENSIEENLQLLLFVFDCKLERKREIVRIFFL